MNQVLVCLKKKEGYNLDVLDTRQKELVALGNVIRKGKTSSIAQHVKKALDSGATSDDILKVASFILGDKHLLNSIMELLTALSYEEANRHDYISAVDDCREE